VNPSVDRLRHRSRPQGRDADLPTSGDCLAHGTRANPLGLDTLTNVKQVDQRTDFARLAGQMHILLLFYDEELRHRLTKGMDNVDGSVIENITVTADAVRCRIPSHRYDF
jgi:hypothetical protein